MNSWLRDLRVVLNSGRMIPHLALFVAHGSGSVVQIELVRWAQLLYEQTPRRRREKLWMFLKLMTLHREYRNVFYLRAGLAGRVFAWLCPPLASLEITPSDIGAGLFIQHGMATLVSAERIGTNCWINQQVTIGYSNRTDRPVIGNNVRISAGAKIIGKVTIGDNAIIGANTVVLSDVPPNATVLGVPGKILWNPKP